MFRRRWSENPGLHYCVASENMQELCGAIGEHLTPWEKLIVWMLASGSDVSGIADRLGLTTQAVYDHRIAIKHKLATVLPRFAGRVNGSVNARRVCPECGVGKDEFSPEE